MSLKFPFSQAGKSYPQGFCGQVGELWALLMFPLPKAGQKGVMLAFRVAGQALA